MGQVNANKGCMMVAYGGLIHMHRERDFVNSTTCVLLDDDIDTWASPKTLAHVATLETQLFDMFGWTIRRFLQGGFVVLVQIVASCGHTPIFVKGKARSSQSANEMYPIYTIPYEVKRK